jgi:hypothetical protein
MSSDIPLDFLAACLNIKQIKSVLDLHNVAYTSKDKKPDLQKLIIENNMSTSVIINHVGLDRDAVIKKYTKTQKPPASRPATGTKEPAKEPGTKKKPKLTRRTGKQKKNDLEPVEVERYPDVSENTRTEYIDSD